MKKNLYLTVLSQKELKKVMGKRTAHHAKNVQGFKFMTKLGKKQRMVYIVPIDDHKSTVISNETALLDSVLMLKSIYHNIADYETEFLNGIAEFLSRIDLDAKELEFRTKISKIIFVIYEVTRARVVRSTNDERVYYRYKQLLEKLYSDMMNITIPYAIPLMPAPEISTPDSNSGTKNNDTDDNSPIRINSLTSDTEILNTIDLLLIKVLSYSSPDVTELFIYTIDHLNADLSINFNECILDCNFESIYTKLADNNTLLLYELFGLIYFKNDFRIGVYEDLKANIIDGNSGWSAEKLRYHIVRELGLSLNEVIRNKDREIDKLQNDLYLLRLSIARDSDIEEEDTPERMQNDAPSTFSREDMDEYIDKIISLIVELGFDYADSYSNIINSLNDDFSINYETVKSMALSDDIIDKFGLVNYEPCKFKLSTSVSGLKLNSQAHVLIDEHNSCYTVTEFKALFLQKLTMKEFDIVMAENASLKIENQQLKKAQVLNNTKATFTKRQMDCILELHDKGDSWDSIASRFCVCRSTLYKVVKEYRKGE